jgi:hypothetical protein
LPAVLALPLGLVALVVFAPDRREVVRETIVAAPAADVHALLVDLRRWGAWSPWQMPGSGGAASFSGPERGVDARASWSGARGPCELWVTASEPARGLWYDMKCGERVAKGVFQYVPVAGGTRVVWSKAFPTARIRERLAGYALEHQLGPELEAGLADLKRAVEAPR